MPFTEPSLNNALAEVLHGKLRRWAVVSEQSGVIRDHAGKQPDILIHSPGRSTVVIENEFNQANVEDEARARLGLTLDSTGEIIQAVIALISDKSLKQCRNMEDARAQLLNTTFSYALYTSESRFPGSGYLKGGIDDFVWFSLHAGTPTGALDRAIKTLDEQVKSAIDILEHATAANPNTLEKFARLLRQDFASETFHSKRAKKEIQHVRQALGIVATVMLNAMVYQQRLAESLAVRNFAQMKAANELDQDGFLTEWNRILKINYWSVFALARDLLAEINHSILANQLVRTLASGADELTKEGVASSEDLAGVVFQRFITDRKFLATFYTRPESAALLAHLAIPSWGDPAQYKRFRVADFACGTGTLIHAAYKRLSVLQELAGGEPEADHSHMMKMALTAADIVPSAAHLTASMLSSVYPARGYDETRVLIPRYGRTSDNETDEAKTWIDVRLGSLELMSNEARVHLLFPTTSGHQKVSGRKEKTDAILARDTPHGSQDVVIMNPPFTRAGSDWDYEGRHVKQYRGLGTTSAEQKLMSKRQDKLFANTCSHGKAGLGTTFVALADRAVTPTGTLAFVLPMSCAGGSSWQEVRDLIRRDYGDVTIVSVADAPDQYRRRCFSADTKMGEILLVARKGSNEKRAKFVCLNEQPKNVAQAFEIARAITETTPGRAEGELTGGTEIHFGSRVVGSMMSAPWSDMDHWSMVSVRSLLLAQVARHLANGYLYLPRETKKHLPIDKVGKFAEVGLNDANIAGTAAAPFTRRKASPTPIYPVLWSHSAERERTMFVAPDCDLRVKGGKEPLAHQRWKMRSHAHFSRGTRFTSQSLTACYTRQQSLGGSGWPTVKMASVAHEAAYVVWANTTLGCLLHWYFGNRRQTGRSYLGVEAYRLFPTLDVSMLSADQLRVGQEILSDLGGCPMLPMMDAYRDPRRHELDRRVLVDMLDLPESIMESLAIVRNRWCAEPTVHDGGRAEVAAEPSPALQIETATAAEELASQGQQPALPMVAEKGGEYLGKKTRGD